MIRSIVDRVPATILRVDWTDPRAVGLRALLDTEMTARYTGRHDDDPDFVDKATLAFAVDPATVVATLIVVDAEGNALAHAALRKLDGRFEVKKVLVDASTRGRGVGRALMAAVESAAREFGADSLILQTGDRQPDAIALYERIGYRRIPVYEPYLPITNSICFEKPLAT